MSIDALIFDVDGTLADTEEAHRLSFNQAFEHHHLGWEWSRDDYRELLKVTGGKERMAAYVRQVPLGDAQRHALLKHIPAIHATKTELYTAMVRDGFVALRPGIARLLDEAQQAGLRLAIATTTSSANIDALLQATLGTSGLDMFDVIACGDQVRHKKPAPDIYLLALETLGVPAERAVALEDSVNGLRAATGAGLWTLVTPTFWTEDDDFGGAGLVLPHLGAPDRPLPGEPGHRLRHAAWLTAEELVHCATPPPPANALHELYQGTAR